MNLKIHKYGDPVLREKSIRIEEVDAKMRSLVDDMIETMYAAKGLGLAAQQVGRTEALCVIDVPAECDVAEDTEERENPDIAMPLVLINPVITAHSDRKINRDEGCLSFPGIYTPIVRAYEVTLTYQDRNGQACKIQAKGLLARAIQHELDHLDGVLMSERMSQIKKVTLSGRLKRLKKETHEEMG